MSKVLDIDALFEKYLRKFMQENAGKFTEDEWENKIHELYNKFGNTALNELDGKTPETYYNGVSGETLVGDFLKCLDKKISVSDYLLEAIVASTETENLLLNVLDEHDDEETLMYVLNMLSDKNSKKVLPKCVEYILDSGIASEIKELSAELLCNNPEEVKEKLLLLYNDGNDEDKEYFTDVLSRCKFDDRVFEVLVDAFATHTDNMSYYADLLARYGDDRALPLLYEAIETDVDYVTFTELKFAIENLGGEYDKKKDFSKDKLYKKIMNKKS